MRASPRKRSPDAGAARARARRFAAAAALLAACAGLAAGTALAGSSVEARALAAARQAAARAELRAQSLNVIAGASAPRVTPVPAKAVAPAKAVPAAAAVPAKAGKSAVRAPQGGKPAVGVATRPQVAAVAVSMRPTMNPVPPPPAAHLDDQVTYQYNALGRRDPFMPLVGNGEYVPIDAPPDVGAIQVVGIVWGSQDKFAIIEDGRGNSTVLRPGDKVMNGVVSGLKRDGVVVDLTVDGQTQSVTIPLTRKGDSNANR
jgi:hypothetical protein